MKTGFKTITMLTVIALLTACFAVCGTAEQSALPELLDHVFDVGTYTELDYDFANRFFAEHYDNYGGGCTAIAKVTENGETIVGRNMDLNISNKAAYVVRTAVEGCYKTVGLMYTFRDFSPDYADVKANGIPEDFAKIIPFMADDVLNEKGLYVEVNMRYGEFWPTGDVKFSCSGTNPDSETRVYMFALSRWIGEHCATVDEAVEYVKTLDVFSQNGYWNYCFLIADATGHYGLLEFADNEVYWNDYQPAQANFYVNPIPASIQEIKSGVGRYDTVMAGIDAVVTEEDMFRLMDSVSYFRFYDLENCAFDKRSELCGAAPFATYDFAMAEENQDIVEKVLRAEAEKVAGKSRQELMDANKFWESVFTEVINCNQKTLFVRFFEDNEKTLTLTVD